MQIVLSIVVSSVISQNGSQKLANFIENKKIHHTNLQISATNSKLMCQ